MDENDFQNSEVSEVKKCCASLEDRVRENPLQALLAAFGIGLVIAILIKSLQPAPKPRSQVKQLLEDIQERLHGLADPAIDRLHDLADESSEVLKKSAAHVNGIHENLRSLGNKLRGIFQ